MLGPARGLTGIATLATRRELAPFSCFPDDLGVGHDQAPRQGSEGSGSGSQGADLESLEGHVPSIGRSPSLTARDMARFICAAPLSFKEMSCSKHTSAPTEWEVIPSSERPAALYHAVRLGRSDESTVERRAQGIERRGLTPHLSRHRVPGRDQQALLFLFRDSLSAEIYGAGGHIYEVLLPEDAPLYRDPALASVGALFTTVVIPAERVRQLTQEELIALSQRGEQL